MFRNREDAALRLADELRNRPLRNPIVLGIPRGGVVLAAVLARELNADLDVILARKLRAPDMPELAIGAIGEDGSIYFEPHARHWLDEIGEYKENEIREQQAQIARRQQLFRGGQPAPSVSGRTAIVTDDGIATGSTMIAALRVLAMQQPYELLVAVPVASPDRLDGIRALCDDVVCLLTPENFMAIGQFYQDFRQVEDDEVLALLHRERTAAVEV